jgi:DNA-binding NarL/FixJ family response regulator
VAGEIRLRRVLVVTGDELLLDVLSSCLWANGYEPAVCRSRPETIQLFTTSTPDLVIADFRAPDMPGPQLLNLIRSSHHTESVPIIFVVEESRKQDRIDAYQLGVAAVVTKPVDIDELLAIVDGAVHRLKDSTPSSPEIAGVTSQPDSGLTLAERRVAVALAQGLTNKQIANRLGISARTVENHISHILFKKGFTNRVEIARFVYEAGLQE